MLLITFDPDSGPFFFYSRVGVRSCRVALIRPRISRRSRWTRPGFVRYLAAMFLLALAAFQTIASGATFTCTPVRVWDGDGPIWCAEGPRVRLAGIAAREIDGGCRPGHPCPRSGGVAARDALVRLIGQPTGTSREGHVLVSGPRLTCVSDGGAGGSRTAAWCRGPRGDLSCLMIAGGHALRWDRYWDSRRCR
jgi:endonuclease YncB( thermonuclease family)